MTKQHLFKDLQLLSFTAGMNQRYHQDDAQRWARLDRGVRILVGLLTTLGVALLPFPVWSAAMTIGAAIAAVVSAVVPVGDWNRVHLDLFRRWSDLRQDVDSVMIRLNKDASGAAPEHLVERFKEMTAKKVGLNALEPAPHEKRLERAYQQEHEARTRFKTPEAKAAARQAESLAAAP